MDFSYNPFAKKSAAPTQEMDTRPFGQRKLQFGKYKGQVADDVWEHDANYFAYLINQSDFKNKNPDIVRYVTEKLNEVIAQYEASVKTYLEIQARSQ